MSHRPDLRAGESGIISPTASASSAVTVSRDAVGRAAYEAVRAASGAEGLDWHALTEAVRSWWVAGGEAALRAAGFVR